MDPWMKIASAAFLVILLIWLWPGAMRMMKESPKGTKQDWLGLLLPIGLVLLLVLLLISMVRS